MIKRIQVGKRYVLNNRVVRVTEVLPRTFGRGQVVRWEHDRPGGGIDCGSSCGHRFRDDAEAVFVGDDRSHEERVATLKKSISILESRTGKGARGLLRFYREELRKLETN